MFIYYFLFGIKFKIKTWNLYFNFWLFEFNLNLLSLYRQFYVFMRECQACEAICEGIEGLQPLGDNYSRNKSSTLVQVLSLIDKFAIASGVA